MYLNEVNAALDHRISGGGEYGWQCWPNARFIDYESDYAHVSVVYDNTNQLVYNAEVSVKPLGDTEDKYPPYRWINPAFKSALVDESAARGISLDEAWDDVVWSDLELAGDFLEKAKGIFNNMPIDTRIKVSVDIEDSVLFKLMTEAHNKDITLNRMINSILLDAIEAEKLYE